jgi:hypothetical protein
MHVELQLVVCTDEGREETVTDIVTLQYVLDWEAKKHNFEVIVGKSTLAFKRDEEELVPASKRFGFVQTLDAKPKRRLFEVLQSHGMQLNQQITFLSDGSDTVRDLQLYMSPEAEHILDWFHLSMKLTGAGSIRQRPGAL